MLALASLCLLIGFSLVHSSIYGVYYPLDPPNDPQPTSFTHRTYDPYGNSSGGTSSTPFIDPDTSPWACLSILAHSGALRGAVQEAQIAAQMSFTRARAFNYSALLSGEADGERMREEARRICHGYGLLLNFTDLQAAKLCAPRGQVVSAARLQDWLEGKLGWINEAKCAPVGMKAVMSRHLRMCCLLPTESPPPLSTLNISLISFGALLGVGGIALVLYCFLKKEPSDQIGNESVKDEVMKKLSKSSVGKGVKASQSKASQGKAPSSVLFLSLMILVGVMDSRYLSMASHSTDSCIASNSKLKASCLYAVNWSSPAFTTAAQSFISGSSHTIASPDDALNDATGEATYAYCKGAFAFIDCLSKGLCLSADCSAEEASAGITTARASIGAWFTSHPVCPVLGSLEKDTGCGDVTSFKRLNRECQAKTAVIRHQAALNCSLAAKSTNYIYPCLSLAANVTCQTRALCGLCDSAVESIALSSATYRNYGIYARDCPPGSGYPYPIDCKREKKGAHTVDPLAITAISALGALLLAFVAFICYCYCAKGKSGKSGKQPEPSEKVEASGCKVKEEIGKER